MAHSPSPRYPPEFWDAIPKVPLTRGALRELDRRTAEHGHIPITRARRETILRRLLRSNSRHLQDLGKGD